MPVLLCNVPVTGLRDPRLRSGAHLDHFHGEYAGHGVRWEAWQGRVGGVVLQWAGMRSDWRAVGERRVQLVVQGSWVRWNGNR